jgi:hypothetical protein
VAVDEPDAAANYEADADPVAVDESDAAANDESNA